MLMKEKRHPQASKTLYRLFGDHGNILFLDCGASPLKIRVKNFRTNTVTGMAHITRASTSWVNRGWPSTASPCQTAAMTQRDSDRIGHVRR